MLRYEIRIHVEQAFFDHHMVKLCNEPSRIHENKRKNNERRKPMAIKNTVKKVDKKIFKRTAASTKKVNVAPKVMRGGIRL